MTDALARIARQLAQRYVVPYTERLKRTQQVPSAPKEINDPVWGTISLTPLETAILDAPFMQRLRHLKQLGVAHWLYPGAGHTRFEHSLGVLHQAEQLISAINRASLTREGNPAIPEEKREILRLAALLHDVGHPVFSHVSEFALHLDADTLLEITRYKRLKGPTLQVSEFIAAALVQTTEFKDLLDVILTQQAKQDITSSKTWANRSDVLVGDIARCILGEGIDDKVPLLHQLISGPFDADKLDYMIRDAKAAGIPSIIDISRLLQKITVRVLPKGDLPRGIQKHVKGDQKGYYLFGFSWSGLSVIDELLLARMILYAKVYRHPKVAAVEAMVQALIRQLSRLVSNERLIGFIYDILDEELILASRDDLARRLGLQEQELQDKKKDHALTVAARIVKCLKNRELFVRGFGFYSHDQKASTDSDAEFVFAKIVKLIQDHEKCEALRESIVAETRSIMEILNHDCVTEEVYQQLDETILILRLKSPSQEELRHAFIFPSSGAPKTYGELKINKDAWSNSFASGAPKGFVFCPREIARYVFVATEVAIAREINAAVPTWMMEEAKQSPDLIDKLKLELREHGYYADKPANIRPRSAGLRNVLVETVVEEFAKKFAAVQESVSQLAEDNEPELTGYDMMLSRAYAWLDQFESKDMIECGLALLEKSRLLSRYDTVAALRKFIADHPEFSDASVVALSKGAESSQIVHYYAADLGGSLKFYPSLKEVVAAGRTAPVLFIDDFCGSGGQVTGILAGWFGEPEIAIADTHEQRRLALEGEREFLRARKVGFLFVAGWHAGLGEVKEACDRVGLDAEVAAYLKDEDLPFAFSEIPPEIDPDVWRAFEAKCGAVGIELLQAEQSWEDSKREERKLGYGNRAMLLFFAYNAPAQTLTCMWGDTVVGGRPWTPIMRRRKKAAG